MDICLKDKILLSDSLVKIYSNILGKSVGYVENYEWHGENCEYHIEVDYSDFGFKTSIYLYYRAYLQENIEHQRKINLLKIKLIQNLAQFYQTDVVADFMFPQNVDGFIIYYDDFFLSNAKCELFKIFEEPYYSEIISKEYGYTDEQISKMSISIIPISDVVIRFSEGEIRKGINSYFDQKEAIITNSEIPEVDELSKFEYSILIEFKKNADKDIESIKSLFRILSLTDKSLDKVIFIAKKYGFI